jgi:hypothetical protein
MEFSSEDEQDEPQQKVGADKIHAVQQAKVLDRIFLSRNQNISVYRPRDKYFKDY